MLKVVLRSLVPAILLVAVAQLAGCATTASPRVAVPSHLFADDLFRPPADTIIDPAQVFAVSEAMRHYAETEMEPRIRRLGPQHALTETLFGKGRLKLEYESVVTRTASEAFEARSGNCLSLVIMTAAFARELGMSVRYQSAYLEESWSRRGGLLLKSGHVNVMLGERLRESSVRVTPYFLTVDFLPPDELRDLKTVEISESLVVAMFMNNRAVEAMVEERLDDAYAWSREAVRSDPSFTTAQNTLGVVYLRRGALAQADATFEHVLRTDPYDTHALANLAEVATRLGRQQQAEQLRERLARLEREPPLHFFNEGLAAMQRGDPRAARDLFLRETRRNDASAEVHFWLGIAYYQLGDVDRATRELSLAAESSATRSERDLYSAKLDRLRAQRAR